MLLSIPGGRDARSMSGLEVDSGGEEEEVDDGDDIGRKRPNKTRMMKQTTRNAT